jgi:hypothetical protein
MVPFPLGAVNVNTIWAVVALLNVNPVGGPGAVNADSAGLEAADVPDEFVAVIVIE